MADIAQYRPKSDRLPKGVFVPRLPKPVSLMVISIDGVPEWLMMAEGGSEKDVADFNKLKASYAELVGEDNGHYVTGTVHVCEVQDDGVVQVGNTLQAWEDGVRMLVRVPKPDDADAPTNGNGKRTTRPKPSSAKKPVAAKTTTRRKPSSKKTTAKKPTAKKTTSAKRPVRSTRRKPGRK